MSKNKPSGVIYVRIKDPTKLGYIYSIMADTDQTILAVIEGMIGFCRDKGFSMPPREMKYSKVRQLREKNQKARQKRYSKLAGQLS